MQAQLLLLCASAVLLQTAPLATATGYHYDRPGDAPNTGHHFAPLPTVSALPPVPSLPPLPTPRPGSGGHAETLLQSLVQTHPTGPSGYSYQQPAAPLYQHAAPSAPPTTYGAPPTAPRQSIASAYRPPSYQPSGHQQGHYQPPTTAPSYLAPQPPPSQQLQQSQQSQRILGQWYPSAPTSTAAGPPVTQQASPQPLRIHYGSPDDELYVVNGRRLKQYAVIEIIDNDIEQLMQPFLSASFFNGLRAGVGASGTGATVPLPPGMQLGSRSSALIQEQQRLAQQQRGFGTQGANGAIAIGSGGLGFIRLPNGNISLGSGSLGYISSQQRSQSLAEARTRAGANQPDALHFGHGPLGGMSFFFGRK